MGYQKASVRAFVVTYFSKITFTLLCFVLSAAVVFAQNTQVPGGPAAGGDPNAGGAANRLVALTSGLTGVQSCGVPDPRGGAAAVSSNALFTAVDPTDAMALEACQRNAQLQASNAAMQMMGRDLSQTTGGWDAAAQATRILGGAGVGAAASSGNGFQRTLSGLMGAGGINATGQCPPVSFTEGSSQTCESFHDATGKFTAGSETRVRARINELTQQRANAACRALNSQYTSALMACVNEANERMNNQLNQIQRDFNRQRECTQQYVMKVDEIIQQQEQQITARETRKAELTQVQQTIETALAELFGGNNVGENGAATNANSIAGMRQELQNLQNQVTEINTRRQTAISARTAQCATGSGSRNSTLRTCEGPNREILAPVDCVVMHYQNRRARELSGGSNRISPSDRQKAEQAARAFKARIQQAVSEMGTRYANVRNANEFAQRFGSSLAQFGREGQLFTQEVVACSGDVERDLSQEMRDPNNGLGRDAMALSQVSTALSSRFTAKLNELDGTFRNVMKGITGTELNQNFSATNCAQNVTTSNSNTGGQVTVNAAPMQQQVQCIEGLAQNLRAMLTGTPAPGSNAPIQFTLQFPGQQGMATRCQGVRDCINVVGQELAAATTLRDNMRGNANFTHPQHCPRGCAGKERFIRQVNQEFRQALGSFGTMMAERVNRLRQAMNQVQSRMAGATGRPANQQPTTSSLNQFCTDSREAICEIPENFADSARGAMGLPNFTESLPTQMQEQRTAGEEASTKQSQIATAIQDLENLIGTCRAAAERTRRGTEVTSRQRELEAAIRRCGSGTTEASGQIPSDRLTRLEADLLRLCNAGSNQPSECAGFQTAVEGAREECSRVATEADSRRTELAVNRRRLQQALTQEVGPAPTSPAAPPPAAPVTPAP